MSILSIVVAIFSAVLVGFVVSALAWSWIDRRKEDYRRRLWVFTTLMANRSAIGSLEFVRALNCVDVVFYRNLAVRQRFKELIYHLSAIGWEPRPSLQPPSDQVRDLLTQLLVWMALDLDFGLTAAEIKADASMAAPFDANDAGWQTLRRLFRQGYEG